ncbi:hypothetical protein [Terrimicrobium sacchariphilum]|uniref:hypothetical protein n=1 Tax=Terrimicrobium sacchariphilum TaxID=690879 RepID=UPI00129A66F0|nr:hypothetical protein [Terrimicrobium sacchariphilum]
MRWHSRVYSSIRGKDTQLVASLRIVAHEVPAPHMTKARALSLWSHLGEKCVYAVFDLM